MKLNWFHHRQIGQKMNKVNLSNRTSTLKIIIDFIGP